MEIFIVKDRSWDEGKGRGKANGLLNWLIEIGKVSTCSRWEKHTVRQSTHKGWLLNGCCLQRSAPAPCHLFQSCWTLQSATAWLPLKWHPIPYWVHFWRPTIKENRQVSLETSHIISLSWHKATPTLYHQLYWLPLFAWQEVMTLKYSSQRRCQSDILQ